MSYSELQYLSLLSRTLDLGTDREDRTGVGVRSLFAPPSLTFLNVDQEFPLLTTKKMAWKSILAETLWFLQGRSDLESLRADGCTWWDDWEKEDGTIGPGYGYQLRYWPTPQSHEMVQVPRREDTYKDYKYPYNQEFPPQLEYDLNSEECWAIGVLEELKTPKVQIQFKSGYITTTTRANWRATIKRGTLLSRDGYLPSASGVGFRGHPREFSEREYNLWYNMIARCYNENHPQYRFYGGAGVKVSPVWHSLEKFLDTLPLVVGYHEWAAGTDMHLDKDYYGSKVYGPDTCVFLTPGTNQEMSVDGTAYQVREALYPAAKTWERITGHDHWYAKKQWDQGKSYRGIHPKEVGIIHPSEGYLWRKKIYHDQLAWIIDEIKANPTSRRLVATMWNAGELEEMALPPCHGALMQFYVDGNFLDLHVNIRSSDLFLGLPTNIASYALVLLILARETELKGRGLIVTLGDAHIYNNHMEAVRTQIRRKPSPLPQVVISGVESLDDLRPDNFHLIDYNPQDKITAPIAV